VTIDQFTEACKAMLDDPERCKCPRCPGQLTVCHGLAGGGPGPYVLCLGCGEILLKGFDDQPTKEGP
jgi:hypothetical protein